MKPIQAFAWFVCAGVAASLMGHQQAQARPLYSALMLYQYNLRDDSTSRREGCQYCHTDRVGSDSWNPFGSRLREVFFGEGERKIQVALYLVLAQGADSDGDGYTDAQEVFSKTLPGGPVSRPSGKPGDIQARMDAAGGVDVLFSPKTPGVGEDPATTPPPPPPSTNVAETLMWASFANGNFSSSTQNGSVTSNGYSERAGDFNADRPVVSGETISVSYLLSKTNGSTFGGAGIVINSPNNRPANLAGYTKLRLKMQATNTSKIRLRIGGNDRATQNNGCYPVKFHAITDKLESYTINLGDFFSESYCGNNAKTAAATLAELAYIEISDVEMPTSNQKRGQIIISNIEFLK
jgi:hypothetical protein